MPRRIGVCVRFPASSQLRHWEKSFMCESMNLDCRRFSATESYESTRLPCLLLTGTEEIIYQLNITVVINIRATNFYHRFSFFAYFRSRRSQVTYQRSQGFSYTFFFWLHFWSSGNSKKSNPTRTKFPLELCRSRPFTCPLTSSRSA